MFEFDELRKILSVTEKPVETKKEVRIIPSGFLSDHVSKDTLPESALSHFKKKYENHKQTNNERNKS